MEMVNEYFDRIEMAQNDMLKTLKQVTHRDAKKRVNMNLHAAKEHIGHLRRGSKMYWTIRCTVLFAYVYDQAIYVIKNP
jgi:hypothetical protein